MKNKICQAKGESEKGNVTLKEISPPELKPDSNNSKVKIWEIMS